MFSRSSSLVLGFTIAGSLGAHLAAQTQFQELAPKRHLPAVPDTTADVAVADFDGDGDRDALAANEFQPARLYLNDGQGIFADASATSLPGGQFLHLRIGIGDIDGDGDQDALLVSGRSATSDPLLLVNDGTGHFADETAARVPASSLRDASRPLFGDVDGDLDLDLVCPRQGLKVGLYLNDGAGFFADVSTSQMPASSNLNKDASLADVDGDLDLDLVLANGSNTQSRLYLNDGLGSFTDVTVSHLPAQTRYATCLAVADVDGDLDLDVVMGNAGGQPSTLLLNEGTGVFVNGSSGLPQDLTLSIAAGDVDGDLAPDLVLGNTIQSRLFLNDGAGGFTEAPFPVLGLGRDDAEAVPLADLDGDGDLDVLMGRPSMDRLYLNDGLGTFVNAAPERIPWAYDASGATELADVDLDGDQDLVTVNGMLNGFGYVYTGARVFYNDGTGSFPSGASPFVQNAVALAVGDVDGDVAPDLLLAQASLCYFGYGCGALPNELFLNDGHGAFTRATGRLPVDADDTLAAKLADVDGDGDLDAVLGNWLQQNRLYRNDGTGTFVDLTAGHLPARQDKTRALELADVDADGDLEIVVGNVGQQTRMYVNEGAGAFFDGTAARMPPDARQTRALALGDADRDGDLDLVLGRDGQPGLYLNDGTGKMLDRSDRMPIQVDDTWALRLGDVDEDGDLDAALGDRTPTGAAATNRLLLNDGTARFAHQPSRLPQDLARTLALALGDLDGDRDLDLVAGQGDPPTSVISDANHVYLNLHRQLAARLLPILGRTYEVELSSEPGYGTAPRLAVVAFSFGLLPTPITSPPLVGKVYLQSPLTFLPAVSIPSPSGSQVIPLAVPVVSSLVGTTFYAQAALLGGGPKMTGYLRNTFVR